MENTGAALSICADTFCILYLHTLLTASCWWGLNKNMSIMETILLMWFPIKSFSATLSQLLYVSQTNAGIKSSAVSQWVFIVVRQVIPPTSSAWLSVHGVVCSGRALWRPLWSCVLRSVWPLARPRGLVKSLTAGLLRHTALRPQPQSSHICWAAAAAWQSSKFMSTTRRDIERTGCLAVLCSSEQLF